MRSSIRFIGKSQQVISLVDDAETVAYIGKSKVFLGERLIVFRVFQFGESFGCEAVAVVLFDQADALEAFFLIELAGDVDIHGIDQRHCMLEGVLYK